LVPAHCIVVSPSFFLPFFCCSVSLTSFRLRHGLGSVLNLVDQETATEAEQECYDWTICTHSRILGCKAPQNSTLSEFRCLNPDEADERYSSETGVYDAHCGLENVMLLWIGSEYMHGMLKHNEVELPDEAFAVLRLFALKDWHTKQYHKILANENDIDSLPFVKDFNDLRQDARKIMYASAELTDNECDALWNSYYARIAKKYGADGALNF
jgi:inositol oxygenase